MQLKEFVHLVKQRAGLETDEEALRIIRSTLLTFSERIQHTHADHLAHQLPKELRDIMLEHGAVYEALTLEEFFSRLGARSGLRYSQAVRQGRAVLSVLSEAVAEGELEHIRAELPREFAELLVAGVGAPA